MVCVCAVERDSIASALEEAASRPKSDARIGRHAQLERHGLPQLIYSSSGAKSSSVGKSKGRRLPKIPFANNESILMRRTDFEARGRHTEPACGLNRVARIWDVIIQGRVTKAVEDDGNLELLRPCHQSAIMKNMQGNSVQRYLLTCSMYDSLSSTSVSIAAAAADFSAVRAARDNFLFASAIS